MKRRFMVAVLLVVSFGFVGCNMNIGYKQLTSLKIENHTKLHLHFVKFDYETKELTEITDQKSFTTYENEEFVFDTEKYQYSWITLKDENKTQLMGNIKDFYCFEESFFKQFEVEPYVRIWLSFKDNKFGATWYRY